jgi:hypothetical protein
LCIGINEKYDLNIDQNALDLSIIVKNKAGFATPIAIGIIFTSLYHNSNIIIELIYAIF